MDKNNVELMEVAGGRPIKMWTKGVPVEEAAKQQLANTARMPFVYKHIAVMPDVHLGRGSTIGSVVPTLGAIIPAAVGVDIGCGMMAAKTTLTAIKASMPRISRGSEPATPQPRTPLSQASQANPHRLKTTKCGMSRPIRAVVVKPPVSASKRLKEPPCICRPTANTAEQAASR